jgi:hypothetical protein
VNGLCEDLKGFFHQKEKVKFDSPFSKDEKLDEMVYFTGMFGLLDKLKKL